MKNSIIEIKENLKNGTISYFSLSKEEIYEVANSLSEEIKTNKEEIEKIKSKIKLEKDKIEKLK